jgi:hypothetical protein
MTFAVSVTVAETSPIRFAVSIFIKTDPPSELSFRQFAFKAFVRPISLTHFPDVFSVSLFRANVAPAKTLVKTTFSRV